MLRDANRMLLTPLYTPDSRARKALLETGAYRYPTWECKYEMVYITFPSDRRRTQWRKGGPGDHFIRCNTYSFSERSWFPVPKGAVTEHEDCLMDDEKPIIFFLKCIRQ